VGTAAVSNDLPATAEIVGSSAALATEPPTFRNLDLVRHDRDVTRRSIVIPIFERRVASVQVQ
jgi:hypothetical protein